MLLLNSLFVVTVCKHEDVTDVGQPEQEPAPVALKLVQEGRQGRGADNLGDGPQEQLREHVVQQVAVPGKNRVLRKAVRLLEQKYLEKKSPRVVLEMSSKIRPAQDLRVT